MKNNIFSKKLYLQGIKRLRTVGIAASICIIILNAIIPIVSIIENSKAWAYESDRISITDISESEFAPFGLLTMVFAPIMVHYIFSFLNERSKSDFYHAIPQTRTCVFVSFMSAVITWITAIIIISSTVNSVLWLIAPYCDLSIATVISSMIDYTVAAIFISGFMALAMTLTGTAISNILIFTLLTLFVRTIGTIFLFSVEEVTPVFLASRSWLKFITFDYFLPWRLFNDVFTFSLVKDTGFLDSILLLVYSFIASIALLSISCFLYKNRRSEIATHSAPNKFLQTVYRSSVTLPFILLIAYCICSDGVESYQVLLAAIALLVYVLFELITSKKIKSMLKALPKFGIPVIAGILFVTCVFVTRNTINSVKPSPEEIQGVSLIETSNYYNNQTYESMQVNGISVNNPQIAQIVSEALATYIDFGTENWHGQQMYATNVLITLDSGRTVGRRIYLTEKEVELLQNSLFDSLEYKRSSLKIPSENEASSVYASNCQLNKADEKTLWRIFSEEYKKLNEEQQIQLKILSRGVQYGSMYVYLQVSGHCEFGAYSSAYALLWEYTPEALKYYASCLNRSFENISEKETINNYKEKISNIEITENADYFNFEITISSCSEAYEAKRISFGNQYNTPEFNNKLLEHHKSFFGALSDIETLADFDAPDKKLYRIFACANYSETDKDGKYTTSYEGFDFTIIVSLTDEEYNYLTSILTSSD